MARKPVKRRAPSLRRSGTDQATVRRLMGETRLTISQVKGRINNPRNRATILCWMKFGLLPGRRGDRQRITLEFYREGQDYITSAEALDRFFERIS